MRFLSKWLGLFSWSAWLLCAGVGCGGESSNPFDTDGGRGGSNAGGANGTAGKGAGGDGTGGGSSGTGNGGSGGASTGGSVGSGGMSGAAGATGGVAGSAGQAGSGGKGGAGGSAGKGGAGGNAGKGGAGGGAGKGGAGGSTGADGGMRCGGLAGGKCTSESYCEFKPLDCRSVADASGVCEPRPFACTEDCPGVCGCDGKFYCNACLAHAAGVDDTTDTSCMRSLDGGPRGDAGAGEPCKTEDQCQTGLKCCPACPIPGCPVPMRCMATGASGQCPPPPP